jgi:hypothetical protein
MSDIGESPPEIAEVQPASSDHSGPSEADLVSQLESAHQENEMLEQIIAQQARRAELLQKHAELLRANNAAQKTVQTLSAEKEALERQPDSEIQFKTSSIHKTSSTPTGVSVDEPALLDDDRDGSEDAGGGSSLTLASHDLELRRILKTANIQQPPKWDGTYDRKDVAHFHRFRSNVEYWVKLQTQRPLHQVILAGACLTGAAMDWYKNHGSQAPDLNAFFSMLSDKYIPEDLEKRAMDIVLTKKKESTETVQQYVTGMQELFAVAKLKAASEHLTQIERGLPKFLKDQMETANLAAMRNTFKALGKPFTIKLQEYVGIAVEAEEALRSQQIREQIQQRRQRSGGQQRQVNAVNTQPGDNNNKPDPRWKVRVMQSYKLSEQALQDRIQSGACYHCGQIGHEAKHCPLKTPKGQAQ